MYRIYVGLCGAPGSTGHVVECTRVRWSGVEQRAGGPFKAALGLR